MGFTHQQPPVHLPEMHSQQDASGARFYTTPQGNVYPSVTTVLGAKPKPGLEAWRNLLGKEKADKEAKRAAKRGDAVHDMVEQYIKNTDPETFRNQYTQQEFKGFNHIKPYLNRIDNVIAQEVALYSDQLQCAGRVDLIGEYNGQLTIVDFKTANNAKNDDQIHDYYLQATAYAIMWHELTGQPIDNITIIMSVEKGLVPLLFEDTIDKYVAPLLKQIHNYHGK